MRLTLTDYIAQHFFQLTATARNERLPLLISFPSRALAVSSSGSAPLGVEAVSDKSSALSSPIPSFMESSLDMATSFIYDLALLLSQIKILKLKFRTVSCIVSEYGELFRVI